MALAFAVLLWPMAALGEVAAGDSAHGRGWKSVGPAPPTVAAPIASLPAFRTIYLNTRGGGLFKSTNGGSSFVGLESSIRGAASLAVDPRDPNVVYVGSFKSIDGGETWDFMGGGGDTASGHGSLESGRPLLASKARSRRPSTAERPGSSAGRRLGAGLPRDRPLRHGRALRRNQGRRRVQVRRRRSELEPDRHRRDRVVAARRPEQRQRRLCRYRRQRRVQEHRRGRSLRAHRFPEERRRLLARQERRQALRGHRCRVASR